MLAFLSWTAAQAQSFTNSSNLLPDFFYSGNCTGVVDMDNDGLDDIVILDQSRFLKVAYQQPNGTFTLSEYGTVSSDQQWGMAVGDIDNDGHKDVLCGGSYDYVHIVNINGPGDYELTDLTWANIFTQSCNLADINNDGWLDGFACHDDGHSAILQNSGNGTMVNGAALIDLTFYPEVNGNDNSGNYGSHWCDFDRDGDLDCMIAKCRQFINNPLDPRRTNILLVNDGNNNYTDEAQSRGLVNLQQSWTSDFTDLDNDGDFDCLITTHSGTLEIYENDGFGYFTNVTAGSGLALSGFYLQAKAADFDNDGFVDIIHAGGTHRYFKNNGDLTFTQINDVFVADDNMHTFGIGDLNHDGWLDLYAGYGDGYNDPDFSNHDRLFINNGGANNFIAFDLEGTISNKGAAGALIEIFGPWGVQIREIRNGESYGITNTSFCHFGIGTATSVDYAVIHWPAGGTEVIENPAINQWHTVIEGECNPVVPQIASEGGTSVCPGESISLSVVTSAENSFWSTGASGESLMVVSSGSYHLISFDDDGCAALSNVIVISVEEDQPASITPSGDLRFCDGSSIELSVTEAQSYLWSDNSITQSIEVTESGTYSVDIVGLCGTLSSSEIVVVVLDSPAAPLLDDIQLNEAGSVELVVPSVNTQWFDAADATVPVFTGSNFVTPVITENTSYWAEEFIVHEAEIFNGGKTENSSGQYQTNSNFYLLFDVYEDLTIKTVKVYSNANAERTIEIIDADQNIVASGTYLIPQGESVVALNLAVPAGTGYGMRVANSNPGLWRDRNTDVPQPYDFPYNVGDLLSITGTNASGSNFDNYYYFFYDWTAQGESTLCTSPREEIQIQLVGISELAGTSDWNLYPNPADGILNIDFFNREGGVLKFELMDQLGRSVIQDSWNSSAGRQHFTLSLEGLPASVYHLRVFRNDYSATFPVIKN